MRLYFLACIAVNKYQVYRNIIKVVKLLLFLHSNNNLTLFGSSTRITELNVFLWELLHIAYLYGCMGCVWPFARFAFFGILWYVLMHNIFWGCMIAPMQKYSKMILGLIETQCRRYLSVSVEAVLVPNKINRTDSVKSNARFWKCPFRCTIFSLFPYCSFCCDR